VTGADRMTGPPAGRSARPIAPEAASAGAHSATVTPAAATPPAASSAPAPGSGAGPGAREDLLFAALANGTRREVLRLLRERGPQPVQALADHFAMRRPSLSEHLRVLREAGLVSEERAGRQRIYRLEAAPLADVQDWLHPYERFWRDRLKGLGDLLDRMSDDAGT
jgi:DNA-binding transcriptional ArsR family regulator